MNAPDRALRPAWLERKTVTVCIAAVCGIGTSEPRIVMCADKLSSSSVGKAEIRMKIHALNSGWAFLAAGSDVEINGFGRHVKTAFTKAKSSGTAVDETNALSIIRGALDARKRELVEEYVQARFAIPYDQFLATGKDALTSDLHREALFEIRDIRLGMEAIFCGFQMKQFPLLIQTDQRGRAHIAEDFAVCGEGDYLAQSVLMNRAHTDVNSLETTLYIAWEAKKYAEGVSSVGQQTLLQVMEKDGKRRLMLDVTKDKLNNLYKKVGPQPLPEKVDVTLSEFYTITGKIDE